MKLLTFCLALMLFIGCGETETTEQGELGQSIAGTWKITATIHDSIPCAGELTLTVAGTTIGGVFYCQDTATTPDSSPLPNTKANEYWITYGNAAGTVRTADAMISLRGGTTAIFTDTVTVSGNTLNGAILDGTR